MYFSWQDYEICGERPEEKWDDEKVTNIESGLDYTPFKAITTELVRMCESVSHIISPLVKLFTVSRQASTADGDQCGQGVL